MLFFCGVSVAANEERIEGASLKSKLKSSLIFVLFVLLSRAIDRRVLVLLAGTGGAGLECLFELLVVELGLNESEDVTSELVTFALEKDNMEEL